ncbi:hypothetical protein AciPR4_0890 [Terriglobus saanensis SP1PR4]|uniref:Uncharacterized protein n=1 Tax=Terriglobus saanensis (strain ATCC BAA-1853 / DSM 23119 / SP1PR4) TaxID=401053 RepID=E8V7M5_TERSS|nr:hypothetical protein AciPR4_0890 [Terriglobus saanensis SP1PR4]
MAFYSYLSRGFGWRDRWSKLAQHYKTTLSFPKGAKHFQDASTLGMLRSILTIGSDDQGLYLHLAIPWGLFRPKLFIPWTQIVVEDPTPSIYFGTELSERTLLLGPERIVLVLELQLARRIIRN